MMDKSENYKQEYFEPLDNKDKGVTEIKIGTHVSNDKFRESKRSLENTDYNVRNKKFSTTSKIQNRKGVSEVNGSNRDNTSNDNKGQYYCFPARTGKQKAVDMLHAKQETRRSEHDYSKQIVYLDCEILDDGTHRQFTQIGCYSEQRGIGKHFFVSIIPDNLEKYERYKQSVNLLTVLNLTYNEQTKQYFFRSNDNSVKPENSQREAFLKLKRYLSTMAWMGNGTGIILLVNSISMMEALQENLPNSVLNLISGFITAGDLMGLPEPVDTEDLYQNAFGRQWDKDTTTCEDTAHYLHLAVVQLLPLTPALIERHIIQNRACNIRRKISDTNKLEKIEITRYSRLSLPLNVQCTYVDLIDLTSKETNNTNHESFVNTKIKEENEDDMGIEEDAEDNDADVTVELQSKLFSKPPCYQKWLGSAGHPTCKHCYCNTVSGVQCDQEVFGVVCKFCPTYDAVYIGNTAQGEEDKVLIAEVRNIPQQAVFVFVMRCPEDRRYVVPHKIVDPVITEVISHRGRSFIQIRFSYIRQKNSRKIELTGLQVAKCQVVCGMTQESFFSRELRMNKIKYNIDVDLNIQAATKCKIENKGTCNRKERCPYLHPKKTCIPHSKYGVCSNEESCAFRHPIGICMVWKTGGPCPDLRSCRYRHKSRNKKEAKKAMAALRSLHGIEQT